MILREMLPERSAEDIAAGRIRVTFGLQEAAQTVNLYVLPIEANEQWVEQLNTSLGGVVESLQGVDTKQMLTWLAQQTTPMLDLLDAYDAGKVLPERQWIRQHATAQQVLTAFLGVCAAAHPLAAGLIEAASSDSELLHETLMALARAFSAPTNLQRPSTAGRRRKSAKS